MAAESFTISDSKEYEGSSYTKGYYISKRVCILLLILILLVLTALVVGLTLGLKGSSPKECENSQQIIDGTPTTTTTTKPTTTTPEIKINYRLPNNLKPYHYDITTETKFDSMTEPETFNGRIIIQFHCDQRTNKIVLHQSDLDIEDIKVVRLSDNIEMPVGMPLYDDITQFYTIPLSSELENGQNYSISMSYIGQLEDNNVGFYKSFYNDAQGGKKYLKKQKFLIEIIY
jgi:hypothetical protein